MSIDGGHIFLLLLLGFAIILAAYWFGYDDGRKENK